MDSQKEPHENRFLLTDDGELKEPLPLTETEIRDDSKPKYKYLPQSSLYMPRRRDYPLGKPNILSAVAILIGLIVLVVLSQLGISLCVAGALVFVFVIGVMIYQNEGAASFGSDGVGQRPRRRIPRPDPNDTPIRFR